MTGYIIYINITKKEVGIAGWVVIDNMSHIVESCPIYLYQFFYSQKQELSKLHVYIFNLIIDSTPLTAIAPLIDIESIF